MSLATLDISNIRAPVFGICYESDISEERGCNYSQQINNIIWWREGCLNHLKHIVSKHLQTHLLQILDRIVINHRDKPDETYYVYSKDFFFEDIIHYLPYKKLREYTFLSGLITRKSCTYKEKEY